VRLHDDDVAGACIQCAPCRQCGASVGQCQFDHVLAGAERSDLCGRDGIEGVVVAAVECELHTVLPVKTGDEDVASGGGGP